MFARPLPTAAAALFFTALSFGLVAPETQAVTAAGGPSSISGATNPNLHLAYVKKKVVIKKKGYKKTVTTYSRSKYRPTYRYSDYGFSVAAPGYYSAPRYSSKCRTVVKYVKNRNKSVRTVRRVC